MISGLSAVNGVLVCPGSRRKVDVDVPLTVAPLPEVWRAGSGCAKLNGWISVCLYGVRLAAKHAYRQVTVPVP